MMDQANQVIRKVDATGTIHRLAGQCVIDAADARRCAGPRVEGACPSGSGKFTCGDPMTTCAEAVHARATPATRAPRSTCAWRSRSASPPIPAGRIAYDAHGNLYFADAAQRADPHASRPTASCTASPAPRRSAASRKAATRRRRRARDGGDSSTTRSISRSPPTARCTSRDVYNHCIRKRDPEGNVYTVAGRCGEKGFDGDGGLPTEALLKLPYGIELAGTHLFVADTGNNRIRVVNLE